MRIARIKLGLTVALFCVCFKAAPEEQNITITGTLIRVMAVGGESTGWAIQLDSGISIRGKAVHSIEVDSHEIENFKALENKRVTATGALTRRQGVERGERTILNVSSIEVAGSAATPASSLTGTEWLLEDLAGGGVIDRAHATLAFPEAGRVAGSGSCNRFFGSVEINGNTIRFGPLGATRMACPGAIMNQETKYLNALQAAERFEFKDSALLVYCKGFEKPLRFTRQGASPK